MTEKDYSLLRPFDLDAAKGGAKVCYGSNGDYESVTFLAEAGPDGDHAIRDHEGNCYVEPDYGLKMAPLCWVEGKPVYPDTPMEREDNGWPVKWSVDGSAWLDDAGNWSDERDGFKIQWPRPKPVKRWINIYNIGYASKDEADKGAAGGRIACVEIELPPLPAK